MLRIWLARRQHKIRPILKLFRAAIFSPQTPQLVTQVTDITAVDNVVVLPDHAE